MAFRSMPTPAALAQMDTLSKVMTYVRLTSQEQEFIVEALGADPDTHPAELAMLSKADFDDTLATILPVCSALGRSRIGWLWAYMQAVAKTTLSGTPFADSLPVIPGDPSIAPPLPLPAAAVGASGDVPDVEAEDVDTFVEHERLRSEHGEVELATDILHASTPSVAPSRIPLPTTSTSPPTPPLTQRVSATGADSRGPRPTPTFGEQSFRLAGASAGDSVDHFAPLTAANHSQHFPHHAPSGLQHLPFQPSPTVHHHPVGHATSPMLSPPLSMPTPQSASVFAHGPPMTVASAQGQVRLDRTVDQNSPLTCAMLSPDMIAEMYQAWRMVFGRHPAIHQEIAGDQLSALRALIMSGLPPYVDMALWGTAEYRESNNPKLAGMKPRGDGTWGVELLDGPGNIQVYAQCHAVYRTGAWMLRINTTATSDEYLAKLSRFDELFGPSCWHVIYSADVQARKYHLERLRREQAHKHALAQRAGRHSDYEPDKPWEHAFQALLADTSFWQDYVILPCEKLLRELSSKSSSSQVQNSTVDPNLTRQLKTFATELNHLKRARTTHTPAITPGGAAVTATEAGDSALRTHDSSNPPKELCRKYYKGSCQPCKNKNVCPANPSRVHACPICLKMHLLKDCTSNANTVIKKIRKRR